ncbi:MAG: COX15/CtaA family protein [Verrucomicrobiae bacterium]|nr:COX15/CtaA family protein [Verrucomicrobiae bacterium]NNJ43835.1 COX15/CtaA family protein [Akkermansiaceae bacterium]
MEEENEASARQVARWLFVCAFFIAVMVVVGGLTRLTGSGLSITEWDLVMGTLPPMNDGQWEEVFAQYQKSPEYRLVNAGMSMAEFQSIFWWEYVHRLIGRTVGFVFLLPFLYFVIRRKVRGAQVWKLLVLFVLGGLQGVLGWYMVKSGLVKDPHVSHFRLTAHLSLAFLLFGATLWQALHFRDGCPRKVEEGPFRRASIALLFLVMFQVALGAMVAGLKAGYMFNTFPKMGEYWVPPGMGHSVLMNGIAIQFIHRVTAYLVLMAIGVMWWQSRRVSLNLRQRRGFEFLLLVVMIQFVLGVFTLIFYVPVSLATLHQFGALVLLGGCVYVCHVLRFSPQHERSCESLA